MRQKGLSLVEMVITLGIVMVLSVILTAMIHRGLVSYRKAQEVVQVQDNIAFAMRDFEKIARGATEVLSADDSSFVFFTYLAGDAHPAPSKVRYFYEDGKLVRGIIPPQGDGPTYTYPDDSEGFKHVSKYVSNAEGLFTYFDGQNFAYGEEDSTALVQPVQLGAVKMVRVTIKADMVENISPEPIVETTVVNLRNLKDNL